MKVWRRMRLRTTIVTLLSGACGGGRLPPHMAALRSVCDEVQQGGYRPPKQFDVGHCDDYSIGNWLSVYYALVAVADVNSTIDMTCQSTEPPHLAFPPRVRGQGSFDPGPSARKAFANSIRTSAHTRCRRRSPSSTSTCGTTPATRGCTTRP